MGLGQRIALGVRVLVIVAVGWIGAMVTVLARNGWELAAGLLILGAVGLLGRATYTATRRSRPQVPMLAASLALVLAGVLAGLVFASREPRFLADVIAAGLVPVAAGLLIAVVAMVEPPPRPRPGRLL